MCSEMFIVHAMVTYMYIRVIKQQAQFVLYHFLNWLHRKKSPLSAGFYLHRKVTSTIPFIQHTLLSRCKLYTCIEAYKNLGRLTSHLKGGC